MMICLSIEQYEKLRRLSDFADWYIDDLEHDAPTYDDDKEDITQAQQVIEDIDRAQYNRLIKD